MSRLRKLIVGLFWVVPLVYGIPAVSLPLFILRMNRDSSGYFYSGGGLGTGQAAVAMIARLLLPLLAFSPGALCVTSVLAAVQGFRKKRSGRIWAIACGVALLVCSIPVLGASALAAHHARGGSGGLAGLTIFGMIQVGVGILILIAFLPRESADQIVFQNNRPAPFKGDGTTSFSLYVAIAVMAGGYFLGDSLCRRWALHADLPSDRSFLHTNLIWIGALILGVVCHEVGHMVAGQMAGMKLLSFRIGPLQAELKEGRWKLIPPRSWRRVFAGGVTMIPGNPLIYDRRQAIIGAAGGTLANLLVGVIALVAMLTAKGSGYESSWDFLAQLAILDFAFFAVNLIPVQEAAAYSDGARIYQILTGNVLEDYRRIVAMTQATAVTALRPKNFDIQLIERIAATDVPSFDHVYLLLVACDCHFDKGEMGNACQRFREAEALCEKQASYWAESCGSIVLRAASLLGDRPMAEKWWQRRLAAKSLDPGKKNYFPDCAYFTITGRMPEAEETWRSAFEQVNCLPETGERAFDLRVLSRLREMLDDAARLADIEAHASLGAPLDPALVHDPVSSPACSE